MASNTPYMDAYQEYAKQMQAQYNTNAQTLKDKLTTQTNSTNNTYDSNARQAYVNYAKQQNALKEQLANQGINGGASESTTVNMANNYAQNVGNNNAQRGVAVSNLQTNYNDNLANLTNTLNSTLAEAESVARQNDIQYQDTLNQRALEQFSATIERYQSVAACNNAIASLNPNDPNYTAMVQLLQLRAAQIKQNAKSSGSGSSKKSSGSSSKKTGTSTYTGMSDWTETFGANSKARNSTASKKAANGKTTAQIKADAATKMRQRAGASYVKKK